MNLFLRLKHWQLFLLCIGIPVTFSVYGNLQMVIHNDMGMAVRIFPFTMLLFLLTFMGWMWAMGTNLYKKLPGTVSMKINKFKAFIIIPTAYMTFICMLFVALFSGLMVSGISPFLIVLIIPLHLFSMYCMFYNLYFVSKTLKAVELQRPVKFEDYSGEFFLIWFFFIGIWIIQPRINRMFEEQV